jgi:glycerol dehydrogenase
MEQRHPRRYIQGPSVSSALIPHVINASSLVVSGKRAWRSFEKSVAANAEDAPALPQPVLVRHGSMDELQLLLELQKRNKCNRVVVFGGGRAIDVGKACASISNVPCIVAPTILSTDAACSSVSTLYDGEGKFARYVDEKRNPSLVVVDTGIIRKGPTRYGCAGIVGALAVFFEAEEVILSGKFSGTSRQARRYIDVAKAARGFFLSSDLPELRQLSRLSDDDVEDVIFASLWTTADLFENVGLSLAHGIYRGLRGLGSPEVAGYLHGELVGLGLLCQLRISETHAAESGRVADFVGSMLEHVDWRPLSDVVRKNAGRYFDSLRDFAISGNLAAAPDRRGVVDATLASLEFLADKR